MPNWCYTQVCFKGNPENIMRLVKDVESSDEWNHKNGTLFCNLRYFLSLNNFDTVSYLQRYNNYFNSPNFRGYIYGNHCRLEDHGDYLLYYPTFDIAWDMDYNVLQVISKIYDVEYSAYSEEPGMDIHTKCKNGSINTYDFDFSISPNYEDLELALDENPELDIDYDIPVKIGIDNIDSITKELKDNNIDYRITEIASIEPPDIYGVYYHYIYGVDYDDDLHNKIYRYPGLDRFNKYDI